MKNLKNQKGITLVALVVTIIVLLILAGVSLSLVAGSGGILGRATNAVDKNLIATIKENVELKVAEEVEYFYEDKYVNRTIDNATTALEYISGTDAIANYADAAAQKTEMVTRTQFKSGGATYRIVYDTTGAEATFYVLYEKTNTRLAGTTGTDGKVDKSFLTSTGADDTAKTFNVEVALSGTVNTNGSLIWATNSESGS